MGLFSRKAAPTMGAARTVSLVKDPTGAPAVDLSKVREAGHTGLAAGAELAGISLRKRGLAGIRAQARLWVDHSGSMRRDYQSGTVQDLVERVLAFTLQIDADGEVPVTAWDGVTYPPITVTSANYRGVVNRDIWHANRMGSTNLAAVLNLVRQAAETTDLPLYAAIVTDGEPDDERAATQAVCDLSRYPVFLKFLAVRPVAYLNELDDLDGSMRLIDNVDTKPNDRSLNLLTCSDAEFQEAMADEWDSWFAAATAAGIIK